MRSRSLNKTWKATVIYCMLVGLTVAGCNESPTGPNSSTPTYGSCGLQPNYIDEVQLNRWPSFPLRYYFDSATFPSEFLADYNAAIMIGIRRWDDATTNKLGMVLETNNPEEADFTIRYRPITPSNSLARTFHSTGTPFLAGGEIAFNSSALAEVEEMVRNGFSREGFRRGISRIAAHEMGHLLGIIGHPSLDVLMGLVSSLETPAAADVNTLIHAYCR